MVKLREISSAKVWQMDWQVLQQFSTETACYSLSQQDINLLLSFVAYQATWSSRWGGYTDFAEVRGYVADLVTRLLLPSDACTSGNSGGSGDSGSGGSECICDEEEELSKVQIVRIGGKAYLYEDCGCSDGTLYQLAAATVGSNGAIIGSGGNGAGGDVPNGAFQYPPPPLDCYASKAVAYLFERAGEYAELIIDATAAGVDILAGDLDEVFNLATLVGDVLFGTNSAREIAQVGVDAITNALNDQTVVAAFVSSWTATGAVSRDELRAWITRTQTDYKIGGLLPVQTFLQGWLNGSVVLGYNNDLNRIAAGCASNTSTSVYTLTYQDADWIVYRYTLNAPVTVNAIHTVQTQWTDFPPIPAFSAIAMGTRDSVNYQHHIRFTDPNGAQWDSNEGTSPFGATLRIWRRGNGLTNESAIGLFDLGGTADYRAGGTVSYVEIQNPDNNDPNGVFTPINQTGVAYNCSLTYDALWVLVKK